MKYRIITDGRVYRLERQPLDGADWENWTGRNFDTEAFARVYLESHIETAPRAREWRTIEEFER